MAQVYTKDKKKKTNMNIRILKESFDYKLPNYHGLSSFVKYAYYTNLTFFTTHM